MGFWGGWVDRQGDEEEVIKIDERFLGWVAFLRGIPISSIEEQRDFSLRQPNRFIGMNRKYNSVGLLVRNDGRVVCDELV